MKSSILLLITLAAFGQPAIQNAQLEKVAARGEVRQQVEQIARASNAPFWIGYAVPAVRENNACCYYNGGRGCSLGTERQTVSVNGGPSTVQLEGARTLHVLLRIEAQQVTKLRTYSADCPLDAGGLRFVWLEGVSPENSIAMLRTLQQPDFPSAIAAIAMHASPAADDALQQFVAATQPEKTRKQAAFWMGSARGAKGFQTLSALLRNETSIPVLESILHALSVSKEPGAVDRLVEAARRDPRERVRSKALFWLAQKAGQSQAAVLAEAAEQDPETEVKKNAVFAISRLPRQEGIPLLLRFARTHPNPAIRKQAIFWLGQSGDPQALAFFEEVLKR